MFVLLLLGYRVRIHCGFLWWWSTVLNFLGPFQDFSQSCVLGVPNANSSIFLCLHQIHSHLAHLYWPQIQLCPKLPWLSEFKKKMVTIQYFGNMPCQGNRNYKTTDKNTQTKLELEILIVEKLSTICTKLSVFISVFCQMFVTDRIHNLAFFKWGVM